MVPLAEATAVDESFDQKRGRLQPTALKGFARAAEAWGLRNEEAARLLDMQLRTWNRAKKQGWEGRLGHDQFLRASALLGLFKGLHLYWTGPLADQWPTLPNQGPLFRGRRPVDAMIEGGLPAILSARNYVDALRGGA
ncbi:MAG: antitoxin Xre-like helix-turn-helix domain-containing protein [Tistlia sp.]|uniref:antitoxin Xre-like helix-turn-helix domain-containing protein n=1 Tax=Tistlia sp. TaxID=3057121 RepID=UPI0034A47F90